MPSRYWITGRASAAGFLGVLVAPTPSRGRSVRNLTVNTFRPFELLVEARRSHTFRWYTGDADAERERPLVDHEKLAGSRGG